eukprot:651992-Amorphochlora_amoeboformis.AAC.1
MLGLLHHPDSPDWSPMIRLGRMLGLESTVFAGCKLAEENLRIRVRVRVRVRVQGLGLGEEGKEMRRAWRGEERRKRREEREEWEREGMSYLSVEKVGLRLDS